MTRVVGSLTTIEARIGHPPACQQTRRRACQCLLGHCTSIWRCARRKSNNVQCRGRCRVCSGCTSLCRDRYRPGTVIPRRHHTTFIFSTTQQLAHHTQHHMSSSQELMKILMAPSPFESILPDSTPHWGGMQRCGRHCGWHQSYSWQWRLRTG